MIATVLLTAAAIAIAMLIMSVGVLLQGRCLRGSCGGPEILDADGDSLRCAACPRRAIRQRAAADASDASDADGD